jgi:membrane-associated phospholipid phosphatase
VDASWYMDVNRFARSTPWAHGFMKAYAEQALSPVGAGLLVLAALVLVGWLTARRRPSRLQGAVLATVGGLAAFGLQRAIAPLLALHHPNLAHAQLLLPRATSYALPDARTAVAGAVVAGLWFGRRWWFGSVGLLAALLLAFARVYTGVDFPADVAAGLGFGAAVAIVLWPAGAFLLRPAIAGARSRQLGTAFTASPARTKPPRPLAVSRPLQTRMPNARAMDALRVASEAARTANGPHPPRNGATTVDHPVASHGK